MPQKIVLDDKTQILHLYCEFKDKELAKRAGGKWSQSLKCWDFAFDLNVIDGLIKHFPELYISPELQEKIVLKIKNQDNFMLMRKSAEDNIPISETFEYLKIQPYNYQKHGIKCASLVDGGFLFADQMGLGKTIQSIAVAIELKNSGMAKNCLVVCPASVKYNWLEEINKFTNEKAIVINGCYEDRIGQWFSEDCFFKIVNYDIVVRDLYYEEKSKKVGFEESDKTHKDTRIPNSDKIFELYDIIIADECHYMKTHSSLRSRVMKKFKTEKKIGLTGTPLDGRLEELHSIFEFIKPALFTSKSRFLERHGVFDYFGRIKKYVKVDEVKDRIQPYYIRRLKKNVLTELPDKIYHDEYVELENSAMKEYKMLAKRKHEITAESEAVVAIIRCRQFCDFPELLDMDFSSDKFKSLKLLLEEIINENKQKVIIFSQYKKVTKLLEHKLNAFYKILCIDGDVDNRTRQDLCNQFNSDDSVDIMLMTDAGAIGLNLQSASYVIHYDDSYSPSIMKQREDRAHRIGQKNTVNVIRFVCKNTVEERVREIIEKKFELNRQIMDEDVSETSIGSLSTKEILELL